MKKVIKTAIVSLALFGLTSMPFLMGEIKAKAESDDFDCLYSAAVVDTNYVIYGSTSVTTYNSEEAAQLGIPQGYENDVVSVVHSTSKSKGVLLDFSEEKIPTSLLESISFCVYVGSDGVGGNGYPQFRILCPNSGGTGWLLNYNLETNSEVDTWATITFSNVDYFDEISENGFINKFELCVRVKNNAVVPFYIDSIKVTKKANDGVAPVLTYDGLDEVSAFVGTKFTANATAYDEQEEREIQLVETWSEGALDENGMLLQGRHKLTLTATDAWGNKSEKQITVNVIESDNTSPIIHMPTDVFYTEVGTKFLMDFEITDDCALENVIYTWSEGALDEYGKLTEGVHTLTVTASDTSNNITQKIFTIYVTKDGIADGEIIDEEQLAPYVTVTFDGRNSAVYDYGSIIVAPDDPIYEDASKTFAGWYNGDRQWDFANDVITENIALISKWETQTAYMVKGASVRLDAPSGLGFLTRIDYDAYNDLIKKYGTKNIAKGTIILPTDTIPAEGITKEILDAKGVTYVDVPVEGFRNQATADKDGYYEYRGSIVNILPWNIEREFTGLGYIAITIDGNTTYIYANADDNSRSIAEIAIAAYKDVSDIQTGNYEQLITSANHYACGKYSPYTTEQLDVLATYFSQYEIKEEWIAYDGSYQVVSYEAEGNSWVCVPGTEKEGAWTKITISAVVINELRASGITSLKVGINYYDYNMTWYYRNLRGNAQQGFNGGNYITISLLDVDMLEGETENGISFEMFFVRFQNNASNPCPSGFRVTIQTS